MAGTGWKLRILERGQPSREIELRAGLTIGRSPENSCVLQDEHVGRLQLRVIEKDGKLCFEEQGSRNSSRMSGRALVRGEQVRVVPGLQLSVGRSTLEVVASEAGLDPELMLASAAGDDPDRTLASPAAPATDPERTLAQRERVAAESTPRRSPAAARDERAQVANEPAAPAPPAPPSAAGGKPLPQARPATEVRSGSTPMPSVHVASLAPEALETPGGGTLALGGHDAAESAAARAFIETRHARLLLAGEVDRRIVPIRSVELVVGRESEDCRISHPAVSARHARIRANLAVGTFQIEDLKSGNRTYLNGVALVPGVAQALTTESHLRFGTVDALFVVELDAESERVPSLVYSRALDLLVAQGKVGEAQAAQARTGAKAGGQHPGEALILAGALKVGAWRAAYESVRHAQATSALAPRGRRTTLILLAILAVALALAAWSLLKG